MERAGATYHVRNVRAERVHCDEIWSFVYAKPRNVGAAKAPPAEADDVWTRIALDPGSKLIVFHLTSGRVQTTGGCSCET